MRTKFKSYLMALLILAPILVAPANIVSAQTDTGTVTTPTTTTNSTPTTPTTRAASTSSSTTTTNGIDGQIIFENPSQQQLDMPIQYIQPVTMKLRAYVRMTSDSVTPAFSDGLIKITLPKANFQKPTSDQLTLTADTLTKTEVTEDTTNYYINYHLADLVAGKQISLPYSVIFTGPYQPAGQEIPITQTIYDQGNQELSTSQQMITINPRGRILNLSAGMDALSYANHEVTDIAHPYGSYYTAKTAQKKPFTVSLYDQTLFNETNPIKFVVTLPTDIEFDSSQTTDWQYDASTRTATITALPTIDIHAAKSKLPLAVSAGAAISTSGRTFTINYTIQHGDQAAKSSSLTKRIEFTRWVPRESFTSAMLVQGRNVTTANVADVTGQTPINSHLTYVNNFGSGDADASVLVRDAKIQWSTDKIHGSTVQQVGPLTTEMKQNTLYGVSGSTRVKLATNLGATPYQVDPAVTAKYQMLDLVYDQPVAVTSNLNGLNTVSHYTNTELNDYRQENKSTLGRFYLEDGWMSYGEPYADLNSGNNDVQLTLKKTDPPRIFIDSGSYNVTPTSLLYSGNTINLGIQYTYEGITKPMTLENAYMYYLLPVGLKFDETKADQVVGLSNLQVIPNYKNLGMTAVYGKVTDPKLLVGLYGRQAFSLPVTATSALRSGKIPNVLGYLVFKNNSGTYDMTDPDFGNSVMVYGTEDPYGLAPDSDVAHHSASSAISGLTYAAPSGLLSTALVKNQTSQEFVPDLGQAGRLGDQLTYRFDLVNNDIAPANKIGLINVLPTTHDTNGSQFDVRLTGPAKIVANGVSDHDYTNDFDIYYATTGPTTTAADYNQANWTMTPSDYRKVRMIKAVLKSGSSVAAGDEVAVDYPAQIPNDKTIPDQAQASNNFQTTFNNGQTFASSVAAKVSVNAPTSAVKVVKVDSQTQQPLSGVKFYLYDYETDQQLNADTLYQTNSNGQLSISDLKPGHYYLKEVAAPAGYVLPSLAAQKQTNQFKITSTQTTATNLTIANVPQHSILIQKIDQTNQQPLAGAIFTVTNVAGQVVATDLQTNQAGQVYAYNLPAGEYTITETKAPGGYQLAAPTTVTLVANSQVVTTVIADQAILGGFRLTNQDQQGKLPLTGSHFTLAKIVAGQEQVLTTDLLTDSQGQIQQGNLGLGKYVLRQTVVSQKYQLNTAPLYFTLTATEPLATVVFTNQLQPQKPIGPQQPTKPAQPNQPITTTNPAKATEVPTPTNGLKQTLISEGSVNVASSEQSTAKLPQANEQHSLRLQIIGWALLMMIGLPVILRKPTSKRG